MGLFSDADINEAWDIVQRIPEFAEDQRKEFIAGFEKGWKGVKEERINESTRPFHITHVNQIIINEKRSPENFGFALGYLVALLGFHPRVFLSQHDHTNRVAISIENLMALITYKKIRPEVGDLIKKALRKWHGKIQEVQKEFSQEERKNYDLFIHKLGPYL